MLEAGVRLAVVLVAVLALESMGQFLIGIPIQNGGGGGGRGGGRSRPSETPCRPLAIPNAVYSPPIAGTANISSGGRVMISCAPSFENVGADWVVCGKDGLWKTAAWAKDAAPSCQASSVVGFIARRLSVSLKRSSAGEGGEDGDWRAGGRGPLPSHHHGLLAAALNGLRRAAKPPAPTAPSAPSTLQKTRPPSHPSRSLPHTASRVLSSPAAVSPPALPKLTRANRPKVQTKRRVSPPAPVQRKRPPTTPATSTRRPVGQASTAAPHLIPTQPPGPVTSTPVSIRRAAVTELIRLRDLFGDSEAFDAVVPGLFRTDFLLRPHGRGLAHQPPTAARETSQLPSTPSPTKPSLSPTPLLTSQLINKRRPRAHAFKFSRLHGVAASCGALELSNATFSPASAGSGSSSNGASVMVTCAEGFEYQGANPVVCKEGSWVGLGECFDSTNSFCRDENLVPLISGLLSVYGDDPLKATQAINRYVLGFRGIRANGLGYIGLNPSPAFQPFETNAYYVPGITGSDATYTSLVIPSAWNMTALPDHLKLENVFCRIVGEDVTAYVLKVLYKESFGYFGFGNK